MPHALMPDVYWMGNYIGHIQGSDCGVKLKQVVLHVPFSNQVILHGNLKSHVFKQDPITLAQQHATEK
jgi:hypothetical protein